MSWEDVAAKAVEELRKRREQEEDERKARAFNDACWGLLVVVIVGSMFVIAGLQVWSFFAPNGGQLP